MSEDRRPGTRGRCASSSQLSSCAVCWAPSPRPPRPRAACASGSKMTRGSHTGPGRSTSGSTGSSGWESILCASTCTGTGSRLQRGVPDWEESDLVLEGLRGRGIEAVVGLVGSPRWANGGRTPNFAPGATSFAAFARAAATRYRWVEQVARLERTEPGALAPAHDTRRLRPAAAQPRLPLDPRRQPARACGRGSHRPSCRIERRLAGHVDPRHAGRGSAPRCLRPSSLPLQRA